MPLAQMVIDETTAAARTEPDPTAARRTFLLTVIAAWEVVERKYARRRAARRRARHPAHIRARGHVPRGCCTAAASFGSTGRGSDATHVLS